MPHLVQKLEKVDDVNTVAPSEEKFSAIPKVEKYFLSSLISSSDVSLLRKRTLSQLEYLSASAAYVLPAMDKKSQTTL